jgi:hypothetical protein
VLARIPKNTFSERCIRRAFADVHVPDAKPKSLDAREKPLKTSGYSASEEFKNA